LDWGCELAYQIRNEYNRFAGRMDGAHEAFGPDLIEEILLAHYLFSCINMTVIM
jgi:hypothetical protein